MRNVSSYTETQYAWYIILIFVPTIVFFLYLGTISPAGKGFPIPILVVVLIPLVISLLLFYRMKTVVDDREIVISYGIGMNVKRIPLESIRSVRRVKNKWYWGAGIKYFPKGMLYSINFTGAVELEFRITDRFVRIGSKNVPALEDFLKERISARQQSTGSA